MGHQPVLVNEILAHSQNIPDLKWYLDATFGRGGHSRALKKRWPQLKILALDQDLQAVQWGKKFFENASDSFVCHLNFHHFHKEKVRLFCHYSIKTGVDMILLDLGPSSPQLDNPQRGFSFYKDGPLDMRMDQGTNPMASWIINNYTESELLDLFRELGEIRNPKPVVQSILRERKKTTIESTLQLVRLIEKIVSWKKSRLHPATLYFLALRLKVNDELNGLKASLPELIGALRDQGQIFVLSFHSLEDRIVKQIFKQFDLKKEGILVNKKVIRPSREEVISNPRSRSAKLRILKKIKGI